MKASETREKKQHSGKEVNTARRKFIALVLAVSATAIAAKLSLPITQASEQILPWLVERREKKGPKTDPQYLKGVPGKHWVMVIDVSKCIACGACIEACSLENTSFLGAVIPLGARTRIVFVKHGDKEVPMHLICQHCDPAPCVEVCPTGASVKRSDGIVVIDYDLCIGCKYCMSACPYGARYVNAELSAVDKCTFCAHRVDKGLVPACVEACPVGARLFGDINEPTSKVSKIVAEKKAVRLKVLENIEPNVYYVF